jgi:hypothetical protein
MNILPVPDSNFLWARDIFLMIPAAEHAGRTDTSVFQGIGSVNGREAVGEF